MHKCISLYFSMDFSRLLQQINGFTLTTGIFNNLTVLLLMKLTFYINCHINRLMIMKLTFRLTGLSFVNYFHFFIVQTDLTGAAWISYGWRPSDIVDYLV